jgi:hypothetical protein
VLCLMIGDTTIGHNSENCFCIIRRFFLRSNDRECGRSTKKSYGDDDSNSGKRHLFWDSIHYCFALSNNSTVPDFVSQRRRRSFRITGHQWYGSQEPISRRTSDKQPADQQPCSFLFFAAAAAIIKLSVAASSSSPPPCHAAVPVERRRSFCRNALTRYWYCPCRRHADGDQIQHIDLVAGSSR